MRRIARIGAWLAILAGSWKAMAQQPAPPTPPLPPPANDPLTTCSLCCPPLLYESPLQTTYFTANAVAFRRDWQSIETLATVNSPTTHILTTHDLEFNFQPAVNFLVGRRLTNYFAIEGSFLGLLHWNESRAFQNSTVNALGTEGNIFSPLSHFGQPPVVGIDFNDLVTVQSVSDFNSVELNVRQRLDTPPSLMQVSGLYGFRYFNLHERFEFRSRSASPAPVGTDNTVNITTNNNLFGIQFGGTAEFHVEPRGWFNFEGKAIICRNGVDQNLQYSAGPSGGPANTAVSDLDKSRVSLGLDASASAVWKFSRHIVGRIGYQCIFLDGLGFASNNFTRNAPFITSGYSEITLNGRVGFHGPFAGLTATW